MKKVLWLVFMVVAAASFAQVASMPKRYTEGTFPTGKDLQANFEYVIDLVNSASETADAAIASTEADIAAAEAAIATVQADIASLDAELDADIAALELVASYSSNTASTSANLIWDVGGLAYYPALTGQGAVKFHSEVVYVGVNYYGGYTIDGVMASSLGSGSYYVEDPEITSWATPSSDISVVASHSAGAGGGLRFHLIASFPASISFEVVGKTRFTGATF